MQATTMLPSPIFITGAFEGPDSWGHNGGVVHVKREYDWTTGIEGQARTLLAQILKKGILGSVSLIGHSLGALVAYRAFQLDEKGIISRVALVSCGCIGSPMPPSIDMSLLNPFGMLLATMKILTNPESPRALSEAAQGHVQVGDRKGGMAVFAGDTDPMIPIGQSRETARLIGARHFVVEGGHHLPREDSGGMLLAQITQWLNRS